MISTPTAIESERVVLSCLVQIPRYLDDFSPSEGFWHHPYHPAVYDAAVALQRRGTLNETEISGELMRNGTIEKMGGFYALNEILDSAPSPNQKIWDFHLARCIDAALRRKFLAVCEGFAGRFCDPDEVTGDLVDEFESAVLGVVPHGADGGEAETMRDAAKQVVDIWEKIQSGEMSPGIPTGFPWLDRLTNGGAKGKELWVIAARPSVGKSAIMMNVARHMAMGYGAGYPVGIFSLEMGATHLAGRVISDIGELNTQPFWNPGGGVTTDDFSRVTAAMNDISRADIRIDSRAVLTPSNIAAKARRWVRDGVRCIFVDYLQRVKPESERARKDERLQIAEASNALKSIAVELDIPVIALAQLNREGGKRGRPTMNDIKGSGDIEQDADLIALMWRTEIQPEKARGVTYVGFDVCKQRNGGIGECAFRFLPELTKFDPEAHPIPQENGDDDLDD